MIWIAWGSSSFRFSKGVRKQKLIFNFLALLHHHACSTYSSQRALYIHVLPTDVLFGLYFCLK